MEGGNLYNQPIVIDNGSGTMKSGFAGEDAPRYVSPAIVGRPKYQKVMVVSLVEDEVLRYNNSDAYVGDTAQNNRGLLRLSHPIDHGIVNDWNDMERLWHHTYTQDFKTTPEEHPLLITEAPLNPRQNRDRMCQTLFETFNVPCLYVAVQAVLSVYALGRTTGVVVDSGDGVTHVVPVYQGFSLPTTIKRMDVAGRDVTENLALNMRLMLGVNLSTSSELDLVRSIKEKCCYVSNNPARDEKLYSGMSYTNYLSQAASTAGTENYEGKELFTSYKLPDGHDLQLGVERFRAPEILFNPLLIGDESPGIHELLALSIAKTDLELRPTLYQNIILSGGTSLLRNFGDRLMSELKVHQYSLSNSSIWQTNRSAGNKDTKMKIKIYAPPERKYTTWIGGSILASLSTFQQMWVTQKEYAEDPNVVHHKCI